MNMNYYIRSLDSVADDVLSLFNEIIGREGLTPINHVE